MGGTVVVPKGRSQMKGMIIYTSKYGSTKQYAEWLGEDTRFPVRDLKDVKVKDLDDVDIIVLGGWVLASKIQGSSWLRKNWNNIKTKKVIVFSTSVAQPTNELTVKFLESSFPPEIRENIAYFPLHGRMDLEKLNLLDSNMMKIASKLFRDDPLVNEMAKGIDGVRRDALDVMFEHIQSLM